jgi:hypothetical protein
MKESGKMMYKMERVLRNMESARNTRVCGKMDIKVVMANYTLMMVVFIKGSFVIIKFMVLELIIGKE